MLSELNRNLLSIRPELVVVCGLIFLILSSIAFKKDNPTRVYLDVFITFGVLLFALVMAFDEFNYFFNRLNFSEFRAFSDGVVVNKFGSGFRIVAILTTYFVLILGLRLKSSVQTTTEYFILIISVLLGIMLATKANNFLVLFISIELVSLSSYALTGLKLSRKGGEGV